MPGQDELPYSDGEPMETMFHDVTSESTAHIDRGENGKLKARVERLLAALPEFKNGDRFTITYRPGKGVELKSSSASTTIAGTDFAQGLLLIWLGKYPPNAGLKKGLLGGECG